MFDPGNKRPLDYVYKYKRFGASSEFDFEIFHLTGLSFGDCILQPGYAGREEIFSTLRGDEDTKIGRFLWLEGIDSNHGPSSLTNKWIETVKVIIVMHG